MSLKQLLPFAIAAAFICIPPTAKAQSKRPPAWKVEILAPAPGAELRGETRVRVKITPPEGKKQPTIARFGIGGPPWVQMEQNEQTGEWTGKMDTAMVPNGTHQLLIVTDNWWARAAVKVKVQNPLKVYFADLHGHTSYSDLSKVSGHAAGIPSSAHQYARDVAKLDVFILTDHLAGEVEGQDVDDTEWLDTREVAWDFNEDGKFVAFPGLEWSTKWGHLNIFDPKTRHWPHDPKLFYEAIAAANIVAKFNHPCDGRPMNDELTYSEVGDKAMQMMEVRTPNEEKAFIRALDNGWHIAPDGSSDTHSGNWGNRGRWTGILAPGLTKRCIWDAMKKRRVYSTRDRNCQLMFMVNGAVMGSIVEKPVKAVKVEVVVQDPDGGDAIATINLFEDGKVVETTKPGKSSCKWKTTLSPEPGKHYYFVKITQADGNLLWSAPVWVEVCAE